MKRGLTRVVGIVALGLMLAVWLAIPAAAHTGVQSYVYLDVTETSLSGRLDIPIVDLEDALGLELGQRVDALDAANANREAIITYLDEHFDIGNVDVDWHVEFQEIELLGLDGEADSNYLLFPFTVTVDTEIVPRSLDVTFDPFFDIGRADALLLIRNDWQGGVIDNGSTFLIVFNEDNPSQNVDLGDTGSWKNFRASIDLGLDHIRTGPDHILFVMVLVLPSVLIFTTLWRPTPTFGAALWRVLKVVTMFTVAHSITFTLAGLEILPLPSARITETIIALSIAAAAFHNLRPIAPNKEWLISFSFGLFHGMGFASLVEGLEVDRSTQLLSLLGRNVGIEIGQSIVVLLVFPTLYLLRRTRYYSMLFKAVSAAMILLSMGWMIERLFETDLGVSSFIEPFVEWPRSLLGAVILAALAAAIYRVELGADRLIAITPLDQDRAGEAGKGEPEEKEPALV